MGKIKVLHIITRLDYGGSAENTFLTVKNLNKEKFETKVITGYSSRTIEVILVKELRREINIFFDILAFIKLYWILKKEKPDIVHTHTSKAGILGRWVSFILRTTNYKLRTIKIVHTPHGHVFYGYFNPIITRFFIILEKITAYITDYIISLTIKEKEENIKYGIGKKSKIVPIYSGIDKEKLKEIKLNKEEKKKELGISGEKIIIGTAGRLEKVKGYTFLIKAAKIVIETILGKDILFLIAGDGSLKEKLKQESISLGISEKIMFLGWRKDVFEIINTFDIFVLPSLNEGMGRVLLEAMLLGKPIIASDTGGIPELVEDGINGFLFPTGDYKKLAEKIIFLIKNPAVAKEMEKKGKEKAEKEEFSLAGMVKRIENLYEKLCK